MLVLITQCSHGGWYKDLVGKTWEVSSKYEYNGFVEYKTRSPEGYINFILGQDCVEVSNG